MVVEALPLGLRADPVEPFFQRDVYFDSADRALRRRGISCRFRIRMDDTRILTVRVVGPPDVAGVVIAPQTFEAVVPELEGAQAIAGTSDPARRLRAVIEPEQLRPRIQFETERRVRRTRPQWWRRGRYEIAYDVVTVRSERRAQAFQELKIRELQRGRPDLAALAHAFATGYGLRPLLVGKVDRAEKVLRDLEAARIAGAHEGREVALIVTDEQTVALFDDPRGLTLPVAGGSGENICRELLRTHFGSGDGNLRFLGTASAGTSRPLLEVWLAKRTALRDAQRRSSGRLRWLPVSEILASAGTPGLRDPRTLAALTVLARSDVRVESSTPLPAPGPAVPAAAPTPAPPAPPAPTPRLSEASVPAPSENSLDRDFSALEFNARVLALAEDDRVPLLARVRFLSILSANLDEFFMVRVGRLKRDVSAGAGQDAELLDGVRLRVRALLERQSRCLNDACLPALAAHGIRLVRWTDVAEPQREALRRQFHDQIFPVITPQAITRAPGHPFPLVPNLRLSLAVVVQDPRTAGMHFAYLRMPDGLPRFLALSTGAFVPIEDVVRENLGALYPGREVRGAYVFRVTRAADLELDEHHAASLLQVIDEETKRRPYGPPVRLEVEAAMPTAIRELVLRELQFEDAAPGSSLDVDDVYESTGLLDLGDLRELARLPVAELDYPPHQARHPIPANQSIFDVLSQRDLLVHHPYDDFATTVERLFIDAADDPDVVAIKVTLYRAGTRSRIVDALLRAAARGKEVFVFVELKARFDEERNIEWVRKLEQERIRVVYGLVDLKTHAKTALIVRREAAGIRRYVHIGTGNYNAVTASLYTDLGLLSADPTLGADLHDLFNELSSSSQPPHTRFRAMLVAPNYLLPRLLELIEREAQHARAGKGGRIRAKLNGLADPDVVRALYAASQAGVDIELIVRGICTLRPGVPGVSERIRVVSILGRFLEHARILHFANAGDPEYYIGSADWRTRNLRRRVEVVTPVRDAACRQRLGDILDAELRDPDAWELSPDGRYVRPASRFSTSTA
jgi:polyphosphate kinase